MTDGSRRVRHPRKALPSFWLEYSCFQFLLLFVLALKYSPPIGLPPLDCSTSTANYLSCLHTNNFLSPSLSPGFLTTGVAEHKSMASGKTLGEYHEPRGCCMSALRRLWGFSLLVLLALLSPMQLLPPRILLIPRPNV